MRLLEALERELADRRLEHHLPDRQRILLAQPRLAFVEDFRGSNVRRSRLEPRRRHG